MQGTCVSHTIMQQMYSTHINEVYFNFIFFFKFYSVNDLNYLNVLTNEIDKYLYILYPPVESLVIVGVHGRHLLFSFLQRQRPDA